MIEYGWDETSSDSYLEILEGIYGPVGLHTEQTIEEVNWQWMNMFACPFVPENDPMESVWAKLYLQTFEEIYGGFINPLYNIEEINAEWIDHFFIENTPKYPCSHAA